MSIAMITPITILVLIIGSFSGVLPPLVARIVVTTTPVNPKGFMCCTSNRESRFIRSVYQCQVYFFIFLKILFFAVPPNHNPASTNLIVVL